MAGGLVGVGVGEVLGAERGAKRQKMVFLRRYLVVGAGVGGQILLKEAMVTQGL